MMANIETRKIFSHERTNGKEEWLTPPEIIQALGEFDLDPCSPINRPWDTAKYHYSILDDGLAKEWFGRVWLNPPYGKKTSRWISRLAKHGNGIALVFARTETKTFFPWVWEYADAVFFIKGRICFYDITGKMAGPAGGPSCLIAYGNANVKALKNAGIDGKLVYLTKKSLEEVEHLCAS